MSDDTSSGRLATRAELARWLGIAPDGLARVELADWRPRWLEVTVDGFTVRGRFGHRSLTWDDLVMIHTEEGLFGNTHHLETTAGRFSLHSYEPGVERLVAGLRRVFSARWAGRLDDPNPGVPDGALSPAEPPEPPVDRGLSQAEP